ncbi:MAG: polysaccharide biosynthesis tyrosine autokinase [Myxococcota bacterium]
MGPIERERLDGDPAAPSADTAIDTLVRVLATLRRRWLIVVATTVLTVSLAALMISVVQPQWRAEATLVINLSGPEVLDKVKGVNQEDDATAYLQYYETQREIISSRSVSSAALDRLALADDPVFLGVDDIRDPDEQATAAAEVDPVERLQEIVRVQEVIGSRVVRIQAVYPDPDLAAEIANTVVTSYLRYIETLREDTGTVAKDNLESERAHAREQLREAEKALDAFKEANQITSIALADRQNLITQNVITLSAKAKDAQALRFSAENTYEQAKKLHAMGTLAGVGTLMTASERVSFDQLLTQHVEAEAEFAQINVRYGERHPEWKGAKERLDLVDRRIKEESDGLLATLESRYKAALATERQLGAAVQAEQKKALELGRLEPRYRELERDATDAAETYRVLSRRDTEIGLTNRVEARPPVKILDTATAPTEPVYPRKLLLLGAALALGLGLGSVLAIGVDRRDTRIRGLPDLERIIASSGLPVLGQLPLLESDPQLGVGNLRAQRRQRDLYTHFFPQSMMAERCRGVRTSVTFALGDVESPVLLVTSPASAEGKSSTAMNLALSFCQTGKNVVLVDADMRRPRLHQVFPPPVDREDVGFASVLAGKATLDEALVVGGIEEGPRELSVLGCGALPQTPAELLDSPQCRRVIEGLRERFDVVIFDTPPILPVIDPLVLARRVHGVILVARCQSTSRMAVQRSLSLLQQRDTNLLGVVLNEVDPRTEHGKYSSEYYTYRSHEPAAQEG